MNPRIRAAALSLSAAGLIALAVSEGYQEVAAPPIKGDVPTHGFGHTGPDVKPGDKTTPVRALITLHGDVSATERAFRSPILGIRLPPARSKKRSREALKRRTVSGRGCPSWMLIQ